MRDRCQDLIKEEFGRRVRRFVEGAFPLAEGWNIEERKPDNGVVLLLMRRRGAVALARLLDEGSLSTEIVREISDLRDANQAYLALIYCSPGVEVDHEAATIAIRLGVRIVEL